MYFQYNPTTDNHGVTPKYTMIEPPGSTGPTAVFNTISNDTIDLQLLLDATESWHHAQVGIGPQRAFLESFARQDAQPFVDGLGQFVAPPKAIISIGPDAWEGVVTKYDCLVTKRTRGLIPIRATVKLAIKTVYLGRSRTQLQYQALLDNRVLSRY